MKIKMNEVTLRESLPAPKLSQRGRVKQQIIHCTKCPLSSRIIKPVPFSGPRNPTMIAIGEAPGNVEDKEGVPFVGPSGRLLRALMWEAGISVTEEVVFMNTVCCWPLNERNEPHTPTSKEQSACRSHLLNQLELFTTPYVLLVGAVALGAFRDDLQISKVHGKCFIWGERRIVMPVYHPAAALRERGLKAVIGKDLIEWERIVHQGHRLEVLGLKCVVCNQALHAHDRDGVPYCAYHWEKNKGKAELSAKNWRKKMVAAGREQLGLIDRDKYKVDKKKLIV